MPTKFIDSMVEYQDNYFFSHKIEINLSAFFYFFQVVDMQCEMEKRWGFVFILDVWEDNILFKVREPHWATTSSWLQAFCLSHSACANGLACLWELRTLACVIALACFVTKDDHDMIDYFQQRTNILPGFLSPVPSKIQRIQWGSL